MKQKVFTAFLILSTLLGIGYIWSVEEGNSHAVQAATNTQTAIYLPTIVGGTGNPSTNPNAYKVYLTNAWIMTSEGTTFEQAKQTPAEYLTNDKQYALAGQSTMGGLGYSIFRNFIYFDLSSLPSGTIERAQIVLARQDYLGLHDDMTLMVWDGTWSGTIPAENDWNSKGILRVDLPVTHVPANASVTDYELVIALSHLVGQQRPSVLKLVLTTNELPLGQGQLTRFPIDHGFMSENGQSLEQVTRVEVEISQ